MSFEAMYSTTRSNVRRYSEFQVCGAAIENARWLRYAGVEHEGTLNISDAVF